MSKIILLILLPAMLSLMHASDVRGQLVQSGDRIRIHVPVEISGAPGAPRRQTVRTGVFVGVADDRLQYSASADQTLSIRLDSILRLSVGQQRSRQRGALRGALWGGLSAGAVGFALGMIQPEPDSGPLISEPVDSGLLAGFVLLVPGALVGYVVGTVFPGTRWLDVPVETLVIRGGENGGIDASMRIGTGR